MSSRRCKSEVLYTPMFNPYVEGWLNEVSGWHVRVTGMGGETLYETPVYGEPKHGMTSRQRALADAQRWIDENRYYLPPRLKLRSV